MIELFELGENGLVKFSPEAIAIKEFKAIYDADTSISKSKSWLKLTAAFFIASVTFKNPYKGYDRDERIELVAKDILNKDYEDVVNDNLLMEAAAKVYEIEETSLAKSSLRSALKGLSKLRVYIDDADLTETDTAGKLIHDAKKYQSIIKDMVETTKAIDAALKEVRKEEEGDENRLRGGGVDEYDL